ncbi:MAG TPA: Rrf2 family transcriptional regulator [Armatimonadetes bacterium]|nr:Rrf2 family transcriptional regulator [Armatimonadota bacterium]
MILSQKCQYALRAVYEITLRQQQWPLKSTEIAEAQAIPPRFLENILAQLRHGGFIDSKRGKEGGYMLTDPEREITVGEIIRFIQGPLVPVHCMVDGRQDCALAGSCPFEPMWRRASEAVLQVYDHTTIRDLIAEHAVAQGSPPQP